MPYSMAGLYIYIYIFHKFDSTTTPMLPTKNIIQKLNKSCHSNSTNVWKFFYLRQFSRWSYKAQVIFKNMCASAYNLYVRGFFTSLLKCDCILTPVSWESFHTHAPPAPAPTPRLHNFSLRTKILHGNVILSSLEANLYRMTCLPSSVYVLLVHVLHRCRHHCFSLHIPICLARNLTTCCCCCSCFSSSSWLGVMVWVRRRRFLLAVPLKMLFF